MDEKLFTRTDLFNFARTCMLELLSVKDENSPHPEITSLDLWRIENVLNRFRAAESRKDEPDKSDNLPKE